MQKEQLSALMDGETLDSELLNELAHNPEMQKTWESYHLIRDSMRGDTPEVLHFDISSRVMAAIEEEPETTQPEPAQSAQPAEAEADPAADENRYRNEEDQKPVRTEETSQQPETPVFNTLPMMGKASPVSLGVPSEATANNGQQQQVQEQRRRINAMLQDYELQRRLHSEQLQFEQAQTQQAAVQVPGIQTLGTQSQ